MRKIKKCLRNTGFSQGLAAGMLRKTRQKKDRTRRGTILFFISIPKQILVKAINFSYFYSAKTPAKMSNNRDFHDFFLTDNSSSINLKYDLISSKFMTGIQNHQKRNAPSPSVGIVFNLIGAVLQMVLALVVIIGVGIRWIWKRF